MKNIASTIASLAAVAALASAAVVGTAAPASAATGVSFCATWPSDGAHYGEAYANQPVFLASYPSLDPIRSGSTGANGCATFYNVPSNQNVVVKVQRIYGNGTVGYITYKGVTPHYAVPGAGTANLGTIRIARV